MTKPEIIAALWMVNHDMSHLETLNDYIRQFDELTKQAESFLSQMDEPQS